MEPTRLELVTPWLVNQVLYLLSYGPTGPFPVRANYADQGSNVETLGIEPDDLGYEVLACKPAVPLLPLICAILPRGN